MDFLQAVTPSAPREESGDRVAHLVFNLLVALLPSLLKSLLDTLDHPPPEHLPPRPSALVRLALSCFGAQEVVDQPLLRMWKGELGRRWKWRGGKKC